jgi:signal peptidase I
MNAPAPEISKPAAKKEAEPFSWGREIRQWAVLILIVLGVHSFIAKPFYIPSESMMANLLVGDRLIVSKYPFGFSYLSPSVPILPHIPGRLFGSYPERGEVLVVKSPSDGADWIKRVVALPGDTVELRDGAVILNGKLLLTVQRPDTELVVTPNTDCPYAPQFRGTRADGTPVCRYPTWRETLPNGRSYDTLDMALTDRDNFGPVTVPDGFLFLLGDNRDNSMDSRVPPEVGGLGLVPWENIVGRAEFTTFSLDGSQTLNPLTWPGALRRDRAFLSLRG